MPIDTVPRPTADGLIPRQLPRTSAPSHVPRPPRVLDAVRRGIALPHSVATRERTPTTPRARCTEVIRFNGFMC